MKFKVYNPEVTDFNATIGDSKVSIPAKSFVIISSAGVADYIQNQYCFLEVTESNEEEYKQYRKDAEVLEKQKAKENKERREREVEEAEEETERSEAKIEARQEKKKQERAEAAKVKIGLIEDEEAALAEIRKTTVEKNPLPEMDEETDARIEEAKKEAEEEAKKVAKTNKSKKRKEK